MEGKREACYCCSFASLERGQRWDNFQRAPRALSARPVLFPTSLRPFRHMSLTSPYSDEALDHRAKPDPLDDLIRASPPRERLVAQATAIAIAAFLVGAFIVPSEYSIAVPLLTAEEGQVVAESGRALLRADTSVLDEAARDALAVLSPGEAVTLVGGAGVANGRLLSVSDASGNGIVVEVRLSRPVAFGTAPAGRAVLRIPAGSRSAAAALAELALPSAFE